MENLKTSTASWQVPLRQRLERRPDRERERRLAVIGIGHELRGDDAAGPTVLRSLRKALPGQANIVWIDAGPAPENTTGILRKFAPGLVLLIDAAHFGAEPGTIRWLDWRATSGFSASSHTLPLNLFAEFILAELGCEIALIGIQPQRTDLGTPLSPAVETSIAVLVDWLAKTLKSIEEKAT